MLDLISEYQVGCFSSMPFEKCRFLLLSFPRLAVISCRVYNFWYNLRFSCFQFVDFVVNVVFDSIFHEIALVLYNQVRILG